VQFVDPIILMRLIRKEAHRRVAFLIAESSMHRRFIGLGASMVGAVPVGRAMDNKKPVPGKIYLPDPDNNPLLIRGDGTNFETKDFQIGGQLVLPTVNKAAAAAEILEIVSPTEIRLRKPFSGQIAINQLTGRARVLADGQKEENLPKEFSGTPFKVTPKIDQSRVYNAVFQRLNDGGCVGIFPEGGSHDRTDLLPLKGSCLIIKA
jgi:glycerol-3-phosphate O-acyltransferase/dihydroxyacetone phosphate acyltransferase